MVTVEKLETFPESSVAFALKVKSPAPEFAHAYTNGEVAALVSS
jgi:hypothetical protein